MDYAKCPRLHHRQAGFTLVELLLALFLFALIIGVVFAAFAAVTSGVERGRQSLELYQVGRAALLRMAQEVEAAVPEPDAATTGTTLGATVTKPGFTGKKQAGGSRIEFLVIPYRRARVPIPSYELCRVAYYVAENQLGKTALFREEDCSGEPEERRARVTTLELTDLATGLDITYYDEDKDHEEWPPVRQTQARIPCRVRLALLLRNAQQYERAFITTVALATRGACENSSTGGR